MSVYNQKLNTIFIHVPRTAGHSMEQVMGLSGHAPIKTYYEFFDSLSIGLPNIKSVFKFSFVRNPIDRFISGYLHRELDPKDINEYIDDAKCFDDVLFRPQWTFVCLPGITPVMDFIGKFEDLDKDWDHVCRRIGIKHKLKHTNKSPKKDCFLTERSKGRLKRVYSDDFKMWYPE
jgi:hypothetical protein